MPNADLRAALRARNLSDRSSAGWKLALAIPATLFGILFANVLALPVMLGIQLVGLPFGYGPMLLIFNAVLVVFIVLDVRRHPVESWYTPKYYQVDGSVKGTEFGTALPDHKDALAIFEYQKGAFAGMPLMTKVTDPHNILERIKTIASVIANGILGGPRSFSRALALRRRIADRSRNRTVAAAEAFVSWVTSMGTVPEPDLQTHLARHPELAEGFALARELDVVARRRNPAEFHYFVR